MEAAQRRIQVTASHLVEVQSTPNSLETEECAAARNISTFKWNGYGYADTAFSVNTNGVAVFRGPRYDLHNQLLPAFRPWAETLGFKVDEMSPSQRFMKIPDPIQNQDFLEAVKGHYLRLTVEDQERIFHAHGHTLEEVYTLRNSQFERVPDVVIYPSSHDHVETIVKAANKYNVVIIPFGGGTNVTWAVLCKADEKRMIVSLDMREMNKIKWIDLDNMMACIEAGACGEDIEDRLKEKGLCFGHEPDSYEFSTLGGWIATRASGMKKNVYGNIEDLLISCKVVTSIGTLERKYQVPRVSSGPDINEIVIGSEGNFGVVTEAVVKIRYLPECKKYGAIAFPSFKAGFDTLRELALLRVFPASIRLVDNNQLQIAQALKPEVGVIKKLLDKAKKFYITKIKRFDPYEICIATLVYEGSRAEVTYQEQTVQRLAAKNHGLIASPEDGRRGYMMTFMIAYIRDVVMDYYFFAESFETSIPYSTALQCCTDVKAKIVELGAKLGVKYPMYASCRITQLYDTGCVIYFYYGFKYKGLSDPLKVFADIEHQAREVILSHGGSISHHHGIGKLRLPFVPQVLGETAVKTLKAIKREVDPKNVFATGNMGL